MRCRTIPPLLLYIAFFLPLLSGCEFLSSDRKDLERTLPVQTIGLDQSGCGVTVSLSAKPSSEESDPLVLSATAGNIDFALTCLQDYSPQDELYFAHVQYILLGSSLAERGIDDLLDWVERSPAMRMDTALFVVRDSSEQAIAEGSADGNDVTRRMASLEREERSRGAEIYTLRNVAVGLSEDGYALCMAIDALVEEGTVLSETSDGRTLIPSGYAVFRDSHLAGFLNADESLGLRLLQNNGVGAHITAGASVLELFSNDVSVLPIKNSTGTVTGIRIHAELSANLLETEDSDLPDFSTVNEVFSEIAAEFIGDAVTACIALDCDLPSLASSVGIPWETIKTLPITIEVTAKVIRGLDRTEEEPTE